MFVQYDIYNVLICLHFNFKNVGLLQNPFWSSACAMCMLKPICRPSCFNITISAGKSESLHR